MQKSSVTRTYPRTVLRLLDSLRKEHFWSVDRFAEMQLFRAFDWNKSKDYASDKFLIIFSLQEKEFTYTPQTSTQFNLSRDKSQRKQDSPRHLFLKIILLPSNTPHKFLIKKPGKSLCEILNDMHDSIFVASNVAIKILHEGEKLEVIFASTKETAYRRIDTSCYHQFFTIDKRTVNIFIPEEKQRQALQVFESARKPNVHPNNFEWDVSEYCEPNGTISMPNLFRQTDYETSLSGYIFKVKKSKKREGDVAQFYLKLKDADFRENFNVYVRCSNEHLPNVLEIFQKGRQFKFENAKKMLSKKINIYYSWIYNEKNLKRINMEEKNIFEQEKIAFNRLAGTFIREIPKTIISRKLYKFSGYVATPLSLRFEYVCKNCDHPYLKGDSMCCFQQQPFLIANFFGLFRDSTGVIYVVAKNKQVMDLLGFTIDEETRIKEFCSQNGKIVLSRKDIEYSLNKYGDLFSCIEKQRKRKTIIGVPKCNLNKGIEEEEKKRTILPSELEEPETKLYINGSIKKNEFGDGNEENYSLIPFLKVIEIATFDPVKECYNILNYMKNLKKPDA